MLETQARYVLFPKLRPFLSVGLEAAQHMFAYVSLNQPKKETFI